MKANILIYRKVNVERIKGTNLLLVVAEKPSSECDALTALPQAPQENILLFLHLLVY